ncbi:MAG: DUF4446 family protein [Eubacterium sp.]|nr:DUF4446 family protein [Eubacterium sp.]
MTVFGIKVEIVIAVLFALLIILAVMLFILYRKLTAMSRKYYALTSGSQGADLEHIITTRFKEIDKIKKYVKKLHKEHKEIRFRADSCICKTGVVKYDAFDNLSGDLSFSVAFLDRDNNGVVLSSMHSKEGCFTYAKEIIKGKSYINLSEEEKEAIKKALTIDEEIKTLMKESEESEDNTDTLMNTDILMNTDTLKSTDAINETVNSEASKGRITKTKNRTKKTAGKASKKGE